jgi:hypothetical protein
MSLAVAAIVEATPGFYLTSVMATSDSNPNTYAFRRLLLSVAIRRKQAGRATLAEASSRPGVTPLHR